jgi:hypothetical protein
VANIVLRVVVLDGLLLYNIRDGYDLLLDWLSRAVNLPMAFPGVHRNGGLLALVLASIWLAAGLVAVAILSARVTKGMGRGAQWAMTAGVAVAVSTVALFGAWRVGHAAELTPQSSQIDFLRRWHPDLRPVAVALPRIRRLETASVLSRLELSTSPRSRETGDEPTLLTVAWLPAGDYQVVLEGERELAGVLTVSVGMTSQSMDIWALDGMLGGTAALSVSLPARAHSLVVRGDAAARRHIRGVSLRPVAIRHGVDRYGEYIIRAARYERARVFALDDGVYMEPTGLWTRANSTARLALTSDLPAVPIDLRAGPVAATVTLESGNWKRRWRLPPAKAVAWTRLPAACWRSVPLACSGPSTMTLPRATPAPSVSAWNFLVDDAEYNGPWRHGDTEPTDKQQTFAEPGPRRHETRRQTDRQKRESPCRASEARP